LINCQSINYHI